MRLLAHPRARKRRAWLCVASFALAGCGADRDTPTPTGATQDASTPVPVTSLIGEIHLHQFPLGSHAWAGFLDKPLPLSRAHPDQLVEYEMPKTRVEGPCALYVQPSCVPGCGPRTYCSATDTCTAFEPLKYIDVGEVKVVGSTKVPTLRMFFDRSESTYQTEPPAGPIQLFAGGDQLSLEGGKDDYAFRGSIPSPPSVAVTAPDLTKDLRFPLDGPLKIDWVSEASLSMTIIITASAHDGPLAYIRCNTADVGSLTVPASMMSALPRPPRDIRLEIERYEERTFPIARPGVGIFVNIAQSTWKNGTEL